MFWHLELKIDLKNWWFDKIYIADMKINFLIWHNTKFFCFMLENWFENLINKSFFMFWHLKLKTWLKRWFFSYFLEKNSQFFCMQNIKYRQCVWKKSLTLNGCQDRNQEKFMKIKYLLTRLLEIFSSILEWNILFLKSGHLDRILKHGFLSP